jgi:hypothetical protein
MRTCWGFLLVCMCASSCSPSARPTYSATFTDRAIRIESYAKSFRNAEAPLISGLQFETRTLARIVPKPTPAQISQSGGDLAFGAGVWLSRSEVDPFMFADRQTALEHEREAFERVALPADAALQAEILGARAAGMPTHQEPLLAQLKLEQTAFRRLLDAEDARLERERTLPRGAADLVRALVLAWPLNPQPGAMHDLESMLAWRFSNIEESLGPNTLSEAERDDVRDVLTELAPRVAPLPKAAAAMVKLRAALDAMWVTPFAIEDEHAMDKDVSVYVGSPLAVDSLDAAFESAARLFEGQGVAGLSVLDLATQAKVKARAKDILLRSAERMPRVPVRTPLDMAPPTERAWSCSLLHALDDARTDIDELAADLAWHDGVVVARWAISTHGPVRAVEAAQRRAQLALSFTPAETSTLMKGARARPLRAIAVGIAASIVTREGAAHARTRTHHWRGIGDAPMDLIDEMLTTRRE